MQQHTGLLFLSAVVFERNERYKIFFKQKRSKKVFKKKLSNFLQ